MYTYATSTGNIIVLSPYLSRRASWIFGTHSSVADRISGLSLCIVMYYVQVRGEVCMDNLIHNMTGN